MDGGAQKEFRKKRDFFRTFSSIPQSRRQGQEEYSDAGHPDRPGFEKIFFLTTQADRNRLDHILPQGYLGGFTIPSQQGRLWVFDIERRKWFESSRVRVAAKHGYYDYSESSEPEAAADHTFAEFENNFPPLRRNFSGWERYLEFLVRYAQMLRTRSDLFRQEVLNEASNATFLKVEEAIGQYNPIFRNRHAK